MTAFKYYLGLDMGTNSVGWAATDPEYRLLKAKGKDLWGIFDEFIPSLRALLIQKDVKRHLVSKCYSMSLRALLIQKDVKLARKQASQRISLRALLIQKDVKHF